MKCIKIKLINPKKKSSRKAIREVREREECATLEPGGVNHYYCHQCLIRLQREEKKKRGG